MMPKPLNCPSSFFVCSTPKATPTLNPVLILVMTPEVLCPGLAVTTPTKMDPPGPGLLKPPEAPPATYSPGAVVMLTDTAPLIIPTLKLPSTFKTRSEFARAPGADTTLPRWSVPHRPGTPQPSYPLGS